MSTLPPPSRYMVTGHPVEHSRSPLIHRLFAEQTGERISYGRLFAPLDAFLPTLQAFAESGGAGSNVTVPFKFDALAAATHRSPRASLAQAANWLRFDSDGWSADNTDGAGLVRDIEINAGVSIAGRRVLILGAGGGASGVLGPIIERGAAAVVVSNRTAGKAVALVERHAALAAASGTSLDHAPMDDSIAELQAPFDVIVNATATSMNGAPVPVPGNVVAPGALVLDMMYGAPAAGLLEWAAKHGGRGRDGLGMLVEQANEAFFLWRGVRPDSAPVLRELQTTTALS